MKSFPSYPYTKTNPQENTYYPLDDKNQQQPSTSTTNLYGGGPSAPSPMAMHSIPPSAHPPPVEIMETLPMQRSTRPLRRRGCLLSCLCVMLVIAIAVALVFTVYGIPASRCCSCLIAYDKCNKGLASTDAAGQKTCLDQFSTCTSSFTNIFFACKDRLNMNRDIACWIRYFN